MAFSSAVWRVVVKAGSVSTPVSQLKSLQGLFGLGMLALLIYSGSGTGLYGAANFNYHRLKRGKVFEWIRAHTPHDALIAGEPIFIDPIQLFGERRGFITSETAHPFYSGYWKEAKRRMALSLRANYAGDVHELLELVEPERITYFIFDRASLTGDRLKRAKFYAPFHALVKKLAQQRRPEQYLGRKLTALSRETMRLVVPYLDNQAIVVDIQALRKYEALLVQDH